MSRTRLLALLPACALTALGLAAPGAAHAVSQHAAAAQSSCDINEGSAPATHAKPLVPPKGHAYFGGFSQGSSQSGGSTDLAKSFKQFEVKACRPADIAHAYLHTNERFPSDAYTVNAAKQGKVILLSWTGYDEAQMAAGKYNAAIAKLADQVSAFGYPVLFEFRWEMDIPHNASTVHSPQDFIASWDLSRKIFKQEHVKNASWVWCPSAWGFAQGSAQKYYPGDSHVDWVCSEAYSDPRLGKSMDEYQSPGFILKSFINWRKHHMKPVLIGEAGIAKSFSPSVRAKWFRAFLAYAKKHTGIRGVAYFDHVVPGTPSSHDVSLGNDATMLAGLRKMTTDKHFAFRTRANANPED